VGCSICWALSRRISEDWFNYFPLFVHVFVLLPASFSAFQRTGDEVLTMALAHGPAEQGCEVAKGVRVNGLDSCLPKEKHILFWRKEVELLVAASSAVIGFCSCTFTGNKVFLLIFCWLSHQQLS
jgi:hypothetical protein